MRRQESAQSWRWRRRSKSSARLLSPSASITQGMAKISQQPTQSISRCIVNADTRDRTAARFFAPTAGAIRPSSAIPFPRAHFPATARSSLRSMKPAKILLSERGAASVTNPAPARIAARQARIAAPVLPRRAGDHQQMSIRSLVRVRPPARHQPTDLFAGQNFVAGATSRPRAGSMPMSATTRSPTKSMPG